MTLGYVTTPAANAAYSSLHLPQTAAYVSVRAVHASPTCVIVIYVKLEHNKVRRLSNGLEHAHLQA